jgi:hypothetical protein
MANVMISDFSASIADVGVGASILFVAGGIFGSLMGNWIYLLPGLLLQLLVIALIEG